MDAATLRYIADIESANGTEPFISAPATWYTLITELHNRFNFQYDQTTRIGFTWTIPTDTAIIHIYAVNTKETTQP